MGGGCTPGPYNNLTLNTLQPSGKEEYLHPSNTQYTHTDIHDTCNTVLSVVSFGGKSCEMRPGLV